MKRVHTYLSSPFFIIIFLKLSCFDKKKKKQHTIQLIKILSPIQPKLFKYYYSV